MSFFTHIFAIIALPFIAITGIFFGYSKPIQQITTPLTFVASTTQTASTSTISTTNQSEGNSISTTANITTSKRKASQQSPLNTLTAPNDAGIDKTQNIVQTSSPTSTGSQPFTNGVPGSATNLGPNASLSAPEITQNADNTAVPSTPLPWVDLRVNGQKEITVTSQTYVTVSWTSSGVAEPGCRIGSEVAEIPTALNLDPNSSLTARRIPRTSRVVIYCSVYNQDGSVASDLISDEVKINIVN